MIVRDLKRLALVVGPLLILLLLSASLWHTQTDLLRSSFGALLGKTPNAAESDARAGRKNATHNELFSLSTSDKKYFEIRFGRHVFNPNVIPHPGQNNTWFIMGQKWTDPEPKRWDPTFEELGCNAQFINGVLMCIDYVRPVPIQPTTGGKCDGDITYFNLNVGPHDARLFYGPQKPYTTYGSNSAFTCFGQWVQDFGKLAGWESNPFNNTDFELGTELQRPAPYAPVEKNWFLFWDKDNEMYTHYDMFPKRAFAKLGRDGSAGPDLAPAVAKADQQCLARYLPEMPPKLESIHQATNSLRVTLCRRGEPPCEATDANTFILTVIQHKTYYDWHGEYEPYVVLFHQRAPYELYAVSQKPLWIHGRRRVPGTTTTRARTDMFYVTSVNWKQRGRGYHGFLDDELLVAFGIEDKDSGAIDVLAEDLLVDLGLCSQA